MHPTGLTDLGSVATPADAQERVPPNASRPVRVLPWPAVQCLVLLCVVCLTAGCPGGLARLERMDLSRPSMERARLKETEGDKDAAIELYQRVLDESPQTVRAHLDIAILLHEHARDFIPALYHYRRYLVLRPETEKRELIQKRMALAEQSLVAALQPKRRSPPPAPPTGDGAVKPVPDAVKQLGVDFKAREKEYLEQIASLEQETAMFRRQLQQASVERTRQREEIRSLTSELSLARQRESGIQRVVRTYQVKRGDSLSKIAQQVYGDELKWEKIYDANRDALGSENKLRVGQVLLIP